MFFAFLLSVVLSLGAKTPLQSTQSVPTISAQLHKDHIFQTALPLNQSSNLSCRSFVSQTLPESYHSVSEALAIPCTRDEGYEIILLDSEHTEYLKIDQNSSIIIRNAYTTPTIWQIDTMNGEIIQLITGNLTLINFEFRFIFLSNDSVPSFCPNKQLVFAGNEDNVRKLLFYLSP
ncbi:MAG: hypothetical protein EZS28_029933 [Streblomastix strix]|uniref:Uncharacterized protein n=1 Tax=Streblomastix strix TaxID=222440 RepID=A0A5J4UWK2_9EUKA|nr:MAG: hypothetical protein EZS28_029933 [Streblomastix strix]